MTIKLSFTIIIITLNLYRDYALFFLTMNYALILKIKIIKERYFYSKILLIFDTTTLCYFLLIFDLDRSKYIVTTFLTY